MKLPFGFRVIEIKKTEIRIAVTRLGVILLIFKQFKSNELENANAYYKWFFVFPQVCLHVLTTEPIVKHGKIK